YGVSLSTIKGVLSSSNKTFPYGSITQGEDKIVLRAIDKLESLPQILILDDCFSAMDINTETIIRKNIKEYISNLREKESKKCTV
ncbi:hypothetical protein ACTPEM_26045, partial [Clostridioides difficile]